MKGHKDQMLHPIAVNKDFQEEVWFKKKNLETLQSCSALPAWLPVLHVAAKNPRKQSLQGPSKRFAVSTHKQ